MSKHLDNTSTHISQSQKTRIRQDTVTVNRYSILPVRNTNSTTNVLTATTLIYAIGAGITAAAGTRLALQWILVKGFKVYSFQLQGLGCESCIVIFRHYLPVLGVGNLRACCLP